MITFENYNLKIEKILAYLKSRGIESLEEAEKICREAGLDVYGMVKGIQPICFDDACWAYTAGAAAALKLEAADASAAALEIGNALQAFCTEGSVADERQVGTGHGKLASMILDDDVKCFCFLAGHESFAAAEGAIGIAASANTVRKTPLKVILNGLGKDAAEIISRFNGFTYVRTRFDYAADKLEVVSRTPFSKNRSQVLCYGANDVREGIAIMEMEDVDISISGNGTNMVRFSHIVAGGYKRNCLLRGKNYFACASGGGIGRTLGPDETSAGPASYGLTDSMSRMYGDTTFAGSSSVPAHVAMMGYVGMGNNPMVGATVSIAVAVNAALHS
ncbi:MAG: GGGtGRT protein [Lachnospiraceae bacterium]|nr:GGGtGRT protein [Lachnospiraceae bacterium]